jgi:hypothetical protein
VVQRRQRQPGGALHRLDALGVHHRLCSDERAFLGLARAAAAASCCLICLLLFRRRAV